MEAFQVYLFIYVRCSLIQSLQQLLFASSTTAQPILTPRVQLSPLKFDILCLLLQLAWVCFPHLLFLFFLLSLCSCCVVIGIGNNMVIGFISSEQSEWIQFKWYYIPQLQNWFHTPSYLILTNLWLKIKTSFWNRNSSELILMRIWAFETDLKFYLSHIWHWSNLNI